MITLKYVRVYDQPWRRDREPLVVVAYSALLCVDGVLFEGDTQAEALSECSRVVRDWAKTSAVWVYPIVGCGT